jgi:hypothetical protein
MLDVKAMCRIRWMDHKQVPVPLLGGGHHVLPGKKKQRSEPASWSFSSSAATTRIIVFRIRIRALDVLGIHNL